MKTIIAGSRGIQDPGIVEKAIEGSGFTITEVVCGGAPGVDTLGFDWGWANGLPVRTFNADWKKHGKGAGPIRNRRMAEYADALIAVWDGKSKGTANMIKLAKLFKLRTFVFEV